jgi:hypothetical protein
MKIFLLLLILGQDHPEITYKQKAIKVYLYIQKNFYNHKQGQYRSRMGREDNSYIWPAGCIQFLNLGYAARKDPFYKGQIDRYFIRMEEYWDNDGYEPCVRIRNGNDKYTDDNIQMAYNLYVAYVVSRNPKYLDKSRKAFEFCKSKWDDDYGGGIWMHQLKDQATGTNNKKSCLSQMATVALFLSEEEEGAKKEELLKFADQMLGWAERALKDNDTGLYFDDVSKRGLSKSLFSWNSAVIAEAYLTRFKILGHKDDLREAVKIVDACKVFYVPERNGANNEGSGGHFLSRVNLELYRELGEDKYAESIIKDVDYWYSEWDKLKGRGCWQMLEFVSSLNCRLWIASELE